MTHDLRWRTVTGLGAAQTLAWASSYYLPAVLAAPMAYDLGVSTARVYAAFSLALAVSALLGPWAGRAIDRFGGRAVLPLTSLAFAAGLGALAGAQGSWSLFAAWIVIGLSMGAGLYEAAFAALVRLYGSGARGAITGVTLLAGFASTLGWPLSAFMESQWGWRGACLGWMGLHLALGLPLNARLPRLRAARWHGPAHAQPPASATAQPTPPAPAEPPVRSGTPAAGRGTALALAAVFAITWFISTAMAAHLPRLLLAAGCTAAAAVGVAALVGPAQVLARVAEFGLLRRFHPLLSARLAALAHPLGTAVLLLGGAAAVGLSAPVFALLHGAGNGILTIAKGTLPLALFGPAGYGERQGWILAPSRFAQALAPLGFGMALDRWGVQALGLSAGLGLSATALLFLIGREQRRA
jgi:MFS family permease